MLNVCAKNRQHMNGPHSLQTARQLFQTLLEEPKIFAMAVLDIRTRDYLGHVFVDNVKEQAELVFLFDKQYWNQGIATEVLQRFLPTASHELGVQSLTSPTLMLTIILLFDYWKSWAFSPVAEPLMSTDPI